MPVRGARPTAHLFLMLFILRHASMLAAAEPQVLGVAMLTRPVEPTPSREDLARSRGQARAREAFREGRARLSMPELAEPRLELALDLARRYELPAEEIAEIEAMYHRSGKLLLDHLVKKGLATASTGMYDIAAANLSQALRLARDHGFTDRQAEIELRLKEVTRKYFRALGKDGDLRLGVQGLHLHAYSKYSLALLVAREHGFPDDDVKQEDLDRITTQHRKAAIDIVEVLAKEGQATRNAQGLESHSVSCFNKASKLMKKHAIVESELDEASRAALQRRSSSEPTQATP